MDAQYPFASRDDIWRVFEELKELHASQLDHADRIARLERRREEDARLKSVWGPLSPFPTSVGGMIQAEPGFQAGADAFKNFDQGQPQVGTMGLDCDEEPRRGVSRANSVRFDESAIHGYYGQANRSASELPLRTGSSMGSHPLIERSLSHRSDGRQSSSGQSHHSARTNSMGLETTSRMMSSSAAGSPLIPPPGLFLLGPVPSIIRCWLTTNFSNDSLQYAAVCSGSYSSFIGYPMIRKFGLQDLVEREEGVQRVKLPLYLPEASVHQNSSRASSPIPQLPTLTIRFLIRDGDPHDSSIQIILGSDVLRSHNADVLFSLDKIIMVDDERNKISIPLVRPENDAAFTSLSTASEGSHVEHAVAWQVNGKPHTNGHTTVGIIGQRTGLPPESTSAPDSTGLSPADYHDSQKPRSESTETARETNSKQGLGKSPSTGVNTQPWSTTKAEGTGVWGPWRRDAKADSSAAATAKSHGRTMKVLRPSKPLSRINTSSASPQTSSAADSVEMQASSPQQANQPASRALTEESRTGKSWAPNPVGGASAFGWLNSSQQPKHVVTNPELK
ncbi:hypothetical protein MPDQ_003653 [Monascus purpureus]|uniref:Ubiquitin carboxyl-terminal hydrolase 19 n=1 Tax=Monascus purpureus TaxID=5098 RepID=A0A507QYP7_MONPU|nr:hypothetical protein MPDQ_003653 [Monascus purpureus]BDD63061.1 hypothetical protein MAP00_008007 [Monascus purpureus]